MDANKELFAEFVLEANSHIAELEAGLLGLETGEGGEESLNALFRAAHSLKGTAGFFGLDGLVRLAHAMETLFGALRERRLELSPPLADALLAAADLLRELVQGRGEEEAALVRAQLEVFSPPPRAEEAGALSAWELWHELAREEGAASGEAAPPAAAPVMAASPVPERRWPAGSETKGPAVQGEDTVRVRVSLLNDLLAVAGEMVLRRNQLLRLAQDAQAQQLEEVAADIDELTTKLQKKVMQTRLQPIASAFRKFPRLVRDLSRQLGKEADLSMQGLDVELDRSLIEALADPLTHLVRNALDHGLETPAVRTAGGKPPAGVLLLRACHENGRVLVDVCDDGAGIPLAKVRAKALQQGLVTEKELAALSDSQLVRLVLEPGFSTAAEVSDISGRGVGLDVVKTNIEKMGGKVEVFSEPGAGTTFRLVLPLTLAIISSLLVLADGQTFAIPQGNVRELLFVQPGEDEGKRVELIRQRPVLRLRGSCLPLVRLRDLLAAEPAPPAPSAEETLRILVVKSGAGAYGLIVDSVYDTEEILVKPLPPLLGNCGLYSGLTVLGDGRVAMILDTENLRQQAGLALADEPRLPSELRPVAATAAEEQHLLLFKCSGSELLGLDLAMVSRVEKVPVSRLQKIGFRWYLSVQGQTIRVIRPERHLPLTRRNNRRDEVYVILPKLMPFTVGLLAEEIQDAVYTAVSLDADGVCGRGILGSAQIEGQLVTLLNLHELCADAAPEYGRRGGREEALPPAPRAGAEARTVLLVEDTPFFLKVTQGYLESGGYRVLTAENGRQAWEVLQRQPVDAVVSDIEMPQMNGLELVRAIRGREELRQLPVIALTSLAGEANKEKGLRAGFDVYQYKLDRGRLLDCLRQLLEAAN